MKQEFSNRIKYYNFILCILVILIHAENSGIFLERVEMLNRIHCGGEICQTGYRGLLPLLRISVLPEFYDGQTGGKVEKPFFQHRDSFWGMESAVLPFTLRPDEGSGVKRHIWK